MERVCAECIFDERLWRALPDPQDGTKCERCMRRRVTTRLTAKTRITDTRAPRPKKSIDWQALKHEFFEQTEYTGVRPFLRSKGWTERQIEAGNTADNTLAWGEERAKYRQTLIETAKEANKQAIIDMIPDMYEAKKRIIENLMKNATTHEDVRDTIEVLKTLKTELGEPTSVSKSQIALDDSIDEAIKELRDVVNFGRKGENAGGSAGDTAPAATAPDPS